MGTGVVLFMMCTAIICGLISIVLSASSGADLTLVLLPFSYAVFLAVLGRDNIIRWAPGIVMLNVLLFCRFVLMPLAMCLTGETSVYILVKSNLSYGVPLMIYELFGIGIVLKWTSRRQRREAATQSPSFTRDGLYYGRIVAALSILAMIVIAYRYRYLVSGFSLITQGSVAGYTQEDLAGGFVVSIWDCLIAWVYVWLLLEVRNHVKADGRALLISIPITFGFLVMIYIGQVSISRWQTLISFMASLFCLICLYPRQRKGIVIGVTIPVLALILTASAFKNSTYSWQSISYSQAMGQLFDVSTFDIYLAGPSTVSDGVTVYQHMGGFNLVALFVDILQDLPFVNHWVDKSLSPIYVFHQMWGRNDLIMPLIGQSMIYFSWPFAPVMSMIQVYFVRFFDRLFYRARSLPHVFIAGFGGAWFGVALILNVTITMSWVGLRIIPFYILIAVTELLGKRRGGSYEMCDGARADSGARDVIAASRRGSETL